MFLNVDFIAVAIHYKAFDLLYSEYCSAVLAIHDAISLCTDLDPLVNVQELVRQEILIISEIVFRVYIPHI